MRSRGFSPRFSAAVGAIQTACEFSCLPQNFPFYVVDFLADAFSHLVLSFVPWHACSLAHSRLFNLSKISLVPFWNRSFFAVGAEADDERIEFLLSELKGKDILELIASGKEKIASVPSGGGGGGGVVVAASAGGGGAAAPAAAAKEEPKEEKKEPEEESDDVSPFSQIFSSSVFRSLYNRVYSVCYV
jgi:large subunit ribosomal protein LP2